MLIRFNIANFLSFDKEIEFNMLAAKSLRTHKDHVYNISKNINILKASAIYGANGAGKSNLIKALQSFKEIVSEGAVSKIVSHIKFRLNNENEKLPIHHEIEFSINEKVYTYGISFDNNIILEEWLYQTGLNKSSMIFERNHSFEQKHPLIKFADKFVKTQKSKMLISLMEENLLKQNELLISKNENLKIEEIDDVLTWFDENLIIIYPDSKAGGLAHFVDIDSRFKTFANELLSSFDVGINSLSIKVWDLDDFLKKGSLLEENQIEELKRDLDEGVSVNFVLDDSTFTAVKENDKYLAKTIVTNHVVNNNVVKFDIENESDGTQRLTDFLPMINSLLNNERTYVIDELDRSLHPSILHQLIHKIMDNITKGQLVFTTHESSLLNCSLFRADEIWFAEKSKEFQTTQLYTLNEFKPRPDLDIEKGYLNGRFGAIPFLAKLEDLNWSE